MQVTIEKLPARRAVFVRHIGPYQNVGATWRHLMQWAGMRGLLDDPLEQFGLCHDDPDVTPPEKIRYDACITTTRPVQPEGAIGVQDVPGGEFAVVEHVGPYSTLGAAYSHIRGPWAAASGRMLGYPAMEFYLNDARSTPEDQLRTKVCMRLE